MRSALSKLLARQQSIACDPRTADVVICGDFNSGVGECIYRLLQR